MMSRASVPVLALQGSGGPRRPKRPGKGVNQKGSYGQPKLIVKPQGILEWERCLVQDLSHCKAQILIVDDQEANVRLLETILRQAGYTDFVGMTDPRQVRDFYITHQPDLILLDLMMPHLDGFQIMAQIRALSPI